MLLLTHEVVVPGADGGRHEEAEEAVREQHLHALVVGRQVALGLVATVPVALAPLEAGRGEFVGRQRTRPGRETNETTQNKSTITTR